MARPHKPPRDGSRRYHDRVARQYDTIYDDAYWDLHDRITWEHVKPHLPRDASARCCDLGCGTGKWGLKLLKSGFATTFVDHSGAMIDQVRQKLPEMGSRASKATLVVADIIDMSMLESDRFALITAMGDPLSICSDPPRAAREIHRILQPGGTVIATADNKLAALAAYMERGEVDELEKFIRTSKTHWLTRDEREQFELTTFTPATLTKMFEQAGFEVIDLIGKTILPIRQHREMLSDPHLADRLRRLEQELSKDPSSAAIAGHLQITARKAG
jgi:ubiquinone/menaquinone biosynthesis C-methylase UbiE